MTRRPNARVAARLLLAAALAAGAATGTRAQTAGSPAPGYGPDPSQPASALPPAIREVGFDQNLDDQLPLDLVFADEEGRAVPLGTYFGRVPVVLAFVYYDCPMLCTQVLSSMASTLDVLSLEPGRDFEVVTISIDPRETPALAAAKKATYLEQYQRPGAADAWHFLTGDQEAITRATAAAGFRYVWDDRLQQFAHPAGIVVLTPDGRFSRYLFGIQYGPRDLRLALVESSAGKVGSPVDSLVLYCYHYDPTTGRYGFVIMSVLRFFGAATVLALGLFITVMLRRERRAAASSGRGGPDGSTATGGMS